MNKRYKTQWVGQYAVASELTRRDYLVAIPLGNTPVRDLLCRSPNGTSFSVQVKSLSSKTYFPLQNSIIEKEVGDLYFVFALIPAKYDQPLDCFILSHKQLLRIWKKEKEQATRREEQRGKLYKEFPGIYYKVLADFKDKWENLPT